MLGLPVIVKVVKKFAKKGKSKHTSFLSLAQILTKTKVNIEKWCENAKSSFMYHRPKCDNVSYCAYQFVELMASYLYLALCLWKHIWLVDNQYWLFEQFEKQSLKSQSLCSSKAWFPFWKVLLFFLLIKKIEFHLNFECFSAN